MYGYLKKFLIITMCSILLFMIPCTSVEAASVSKPTVTSVSKKAGKTIIKFKKRRGYVIYYTTNGEIPKKGTSYTKKYSYSKGLTITRGKTIKAISYKGSKKSKVITKTYSVYPKPKLTNTK